MKTDKVYRPFNTRLTAAGGTLLGLVLSSAKAVKIHAYSLQSEVDGQTVYFYEAGTGKQISQKWVLNVREGAIVAAFTKAARIKPDRVGRDIGLNLANNTAVNVELIYSNEDEDIYRE